MFSKTVFLLLIALPNLAWAYLPPAFFVYSHIAEQRAKSTLPFLVITVSKPMGSGTEEVIGTFLLPPWQKEKGAWPSLSLLLQGDSEELMQSVSNFGIPVQKEADLLRANKEQVSAMKEPPKPFYRTDKRMGLKRFRQTYSWVHKEAERSIWIEKDSFFPLKIEGPCPNEVAELSWAKAGENKCELDFRNILSLRRGTPQNSRITLWKDGQQVLFFTVDRMLNSKPSSSNFSGIAPEIQSIANQILR
jgi:hypothetical protein